MHQPLAAPSVAGSPTPNKAFMEADVLAFPDSRVKVHQMAEEDDRVAIWATYSGTQGGAMGPFLPKSTD